MVSFRTRNTLIIKIINIIEKWNNSILVTAIYLWF